MSYWSWQGKTWLLGFGMLALAQLQVIVIYKHIDFVNLFFLDIFLLIILIGLPEPHILVVLWEKVKQ
jgi:hypothetical protein